MRVSDDLMGRRLGRCPLSAGEEGGDIAHNESQGVENDPGDDDALQPRPGLIHRSAGAGEVHHQERHSRRHDGGDGGDGEDLVVDIFHDIVGFRPDRCTSRRDRLTEQRGQTGAQVDHEGAAGGAQLVFAPAKAQRRRFVLIQGKTSFLIEFLLKKKQHPSVSDAVSVAAEGQEKDAGGILLRSFSVVLTVLSMVSLTYMDLRFKGKNVPI